MYRSEHKFEVHEKNHLYFIENKINFNNYIDDFVIEIYFVNTDWPGNNTIHKAMIELNGVRGNRTWLNYLFRELMKKSRGIFD